LHLLFIIMLTRLYGLPAGGAFNVPVRWIGEYVGDLLIAWTAKRTHLMRQDRQPYASYDNDLWPRSGDLLLSPMCREWYWIILDEDNHPYFDLERETDQPQQGAQLFAETRRWLQRKVHIAAAAVCNVEMEDVHVRSFCSCATRAKGPNLYKLSYHLVFRVEVGGEALLFPKWLLKMFAVASETEMSTLPADKMVYANGIQKYRAIGSTKDQKVESILEPFYITKERAAIETLLLCVRSHPAYQIIYRHFWRTLLFHSYPRPLPGDRTLIFPREQWLEKLEMTTQQRVHEVMRRVFHTDAAELLIQRVSRYISEVFECDVALVRARFREGEVSGRLSVFPDQLAHCAKRFGLTDEEAYKIIPEIVYEVVDVNNISMKKLLELLPGTILGDAGSGTYEIYFALFRAAVIANCRDEWFSWCDKTVRPECQPGIREKHWEHQARRLDERRQRGDRCTGFSTALEVLQNVNCADIHIEAIMNAIHDAHDMQVDDEVPGCPCERNVMTYYRVHCLLQPNDIHYIVLVCQLCNRRRNLGQIHPSLTYSNPTWISEENIKNRATTALSNLSGTAYDSSARDATGQTHYVGHPTKLMVISGCGTGKTELAIEVIKRKRDHLYIVPLISVALIEFWAERLRTELGEEDAKRVIVNHHLNRGVSLFDWVRERVKPLVIITTLESFYRVARLLQNPSLCVPPITVVVDEATKVLMHFNSSTMMAHLGKSLRGFVSVLRGAKRLMFMDADMTLTTLHLIDVMFPRFRTQTMINIGAKPSIKTMTYAPSPDILLSEMQWRLSTFMPAGRKLVIFLFSTEKKWLWRVKKAWESVNEGIPFVLYDAENRPPEDFAESCCEVLDSGDCDAVVYGVTPVISSGVSIVIDSDKYDSFVYLYMGNPRFLESIQQSQRVRNPVPVLFHCPSVNAQFQDGTVHPLQFTKHDNIKEMIEQRSRPETLEEEYLPLFIEHAMMEAWGDSYPMKWIMYNLAMREGMTWVEKNLDAWKQQLEDIIPLDVPRAVWMDDGRTKERQNIFDKFECTTATNERDVEAFGNVQTVLAALMCFPGDLWDLVKEPGRYKEWTNLYANEYGDGTDYGQHSIPLVAIQLQKILSAYGIRTPWSLPKWLKRLEGSVKTRLDALDFPSYVVDALRTAPFIKRTYVSLLNVIQQRDHKTILKRLYEMFGCTVRSDKKAVYLLSARTVALQKFLRNSRFQVQDNSSQQVKESWKRSGFLRSLLPRQRVKELLKIEELDEYHLYYFDQ